MDGNKSKAQSRTKFISGYSRLSNPSNKDKRAQNQTKRAQNQTTKSLNQTKKPKNQTKNHASKPTELIFHLSISYTSYNR
jgi:hypothetical protein